eukprot:COSAG01_NODE_36584_length_515_cov_2.584135_1_plen_124_part_10
MLMRQGELLLQGLQVPVDTEGAAATGARGHGGGRNGGSQYRCCPWTRRSRIHASFGIFGGGHRKRPSRCVSEQPRSSVARPHHDFAHAGIPLSEPAAADRLGIGFGWLQNAWLLHARLKIHRGG